MQIHTLPDACCLYVLPNSENFLYVIEVGSERVAQWTF